jgi:hypothetical protein
MSICVESYRICCRCATVDLPDFVISDVRPSSDCHSVLNSFLRHFNINLAQSDVSDVALIFSGRRLNIKDSVGAVFGSMPVTLPLSPVEFTTHSPPLGSLRSCNNPAFFNISAQATASGPFVRCSSPCSPCC